MKHNPTIDTILTRRSVKGYTPAPVSQEDLSTILACGQHAPCGSNQQLYRIVAIQNRAIIREMLRIYHEDGGNQADPFYGALTIVVVFESDQSFTPVHNGSAVIENMLLAASSLGISSCWIHTVTRIFSTDAGKALQQRLGVPEGYFAVGSAILGENAEPIPAKKPRKDTIILIR